MTVEPKIKDQVREFYDAVGWQQIGDGLYQNARYEDLRAVAQDYLHRCHLRVARHLPRQGRYLLDAGSGPIQYPEYLEYSREFRYRVCLDISRQALVEARSRIGGHGLFVVGDIAKLPFKREAFEGVVSLHTVHHLPANEHESAFRGFSRVACFGGKIAVVYSWGEASPLMRLFRPAVRMASRLARAIQRRTGRQPDESIRFTSPNPDANRLLQAPGTFTYKHDYRWIAANLGDLPGFQVRVWRSVSPAFMRAFIHRSLLGHIWLRLLFWLEERFPEFFGRIGQYPLIVYEKPARATKDRG